MSTTQPVSPISPLDQVAFTNNEQDNSFVEDDLEQPTDYEGGEAIFLSLMTLMSLHSLQNLLRKGRNKRRKSILPTPLSRIYDKCYLIFW